MMLRLTASLAMLFAGLTSAAPQVTPADPKLNSDKGPAVPADATRPVTAGDLKAVLDRLDRLALDLKKVDDQNSNLAALATERLADLTRRMDSVQREVTDLRGRMDSLDRRPTGPDRSLRVDAGGATVQLVNAHLSIEMTALVNNGVHTVEPGRSLAVPVVAGPVNVQVLQTDASPRARALTAGQTMVVTMR